MQSPKSLPASSPAHSDALAASPDAQPAPPTSRAHREYQERLAREQQQMMEQLISTGLAKVADLVQLGFTEEEIGAAGFQPPSPHREEEECEHEQALWATAAARQAESSADARRAKARKRGWHNRQDVNESTPVTAETPALSEDDWRDPKTTAKVMSGASPVRPARCSPPTAFSSPSPSHAVLLSERARADALHSARTVDQFRLQQRASPHNSCGCLADNCARVLHYETEGDDEGGACTTTVTPAVVAEAQPTRAANTALKFSGLDVAVAKEIAQMLQVPAHDAAREEHRRMQEYLESREDGNMPYM
ncbi:hypothetical protein ABL78_3000 [Leptomonas seymouri]|uniref:Uncharacterized protein n=1 Tax=Leptomonas seymouri TaxID=5684 RepID=A0A0N1PDZ9_LEPSE|nr:hypothetical protein ABL78_3000 [Leptomonas seymouri]|eukprot:KPI87922.1 hypothetical protein ABL78_3000 [Leptomonas seymouri]